MEPPSSKTASLEQRRRQRNNLTRRANLPVDRRLADLEADTVKLVEIIEGQERDILRLEKYVRKLTRLLIDSLPEAPPT